MATSSSAVSAPTTKSDGEEELPQCSVCLGDIGPGESRSAAPVASGCTDVFHWHCIEAAIAVSSKCPNCRRALHLHGLLRLDPEKPNAPTLVPVLETRGGRQRRRRPEAVASTTRTAGAMGGAAAVEGAAATLAGFSSSSFSSSTEEGDDDDDSSVRSEECTRHPYGLGRSFRAAYAYPAANLGHDWELFGVRRGGIRGVGAAVGISSTLQRVRKSLVILEKRKGLRESVGKIALKNWFYTSSRAGRSLAGLGRILVHRPGRVVGTQPFLGFALRKVSLD